jgi:exosortase/archaeosortase family protein
MNTALFQSIRQWILQPKFEKERALVLFFIKLLAIWLSWKGIFWVLGEEKVPIQERVIPAVSVIWESFNLWLVEILLHISQSVLEGLGYASKVTERSIWIEDVHAVGVGNYCLGLQLMYYNTLLVLISQASAKRKIIGIGFGIIITNVFNVIRITGLALIALHYPTWIEVAHDHIFNIMVFGTMIGFYMRYIAK